MDSRERVARTLRHEAVDRVPRQLWYLPGVYMFRHQELLDMLDRHPNDFGPADCTFGTGRRCRGDENVPGFYTDAWGCVWKVAEPGVVGEVKEHPIDELTDVDRYEIPWELLDEADFTRVNRSCAETSKFVLVGTEVRPFERMQFLRGTERLFMDLAYGEKEILTLRDRLHEFYVRQIEMLAATDVDGVSFMDDWGTQQTLLISPEIWRAVYKPLYKDYCDILHARGKSVFFHSDGHIEAIFPDLIEIGVDAVNSQLFCMDIEKLGERYAGKVTFWGEIDRQHVLPFGTPDDVRAAVRRVANATIKGPRTGVIAQCEWGNRDPAENIEAVFEEWDRI